MKFKWIGIYLCMYVCEYNAGKDKNQIFNASLSFIRKQSPANCIFSYFI